MSKRIIVAVILILLSAMTVFGNRPQSVSFDQYTGFSQYTYTIEKQTWWLDGTHVDPNHVVVNSTQNPRCTWDINEHSEFHASGYLPAGGSTAQTDCHVWDTNPIYSCFSGICAWWSGNSNWVGLQVYAPSNQLATSICTQGRCFDGTPVYSPKDRLYAYNVCVEVLYSPDDPAIIEILGSGGGLGAPSSIVRTVANPTGKDIKNIQINWGLASDVFPAPGCPAYPKSGWNIQDAYPFRWVN